MIYLQVIAILLLLAVLTQRQVQLSTLRHIKEKLHIMSSNLDRIEAAAAKLAEDVGNVLRAIDALKAIVADLQAQVAAGQLDQARLAEAAAKLEGVDSDLDAIAPDAAPVEG